MKIVFKAILTALILVCGISAQTIKCEGCTPQVIIDGVVIKSGDTQEVGLPDAPPFLTNRSIVFTYDILASNNGLCSLDQYEECVALSGCGVDLFVSFDFGGGVGWLPQSVDHTMGSSNISQRIYSVTLNSGCGAQASSGVVTFKFFNQTGSTISSAQIVFEYIVECTPCVGIVEFAGMHHSEAAKQLATNEWADLTGVAI